MIPSGECNENDSIDRKLQWKVVSYLFDEKKKRILFVWFVVVPSFICEYNWMKRADYMCLENRHQNEKKILTARLLIIEKQHV